MEKSKYLVAAGRTQESFERGWDIDYGCDTMKEARSRAKYLLTEEYMLAAEMSEPLGYSQVLNSKGECVADFFQ